MSGGMRFPSALFLCGATFLLFLLYLIPWHQLPTLEHPISISFNIQNYRHAITTTKDGTIYITPTPVDIVQRAFPGLISYRTIINLDIRFNMTLSDVIVLLHMQKTGGTSFEKHIVQDLQMEQPCICWRRKKRCKCPRPSTSINKNASSLRMSEPWLFSRFSTGWICGLHADWTELTSCVNSELDKAVGTPVKRRYFYVTMVRDPIHRFFSEFRHVQRGATWKASKHICDGRFATAEELGSCYSGRTWNGVSLSEFLSCPHNMAFNRQARMLADLYLVGCYNRSVMSETKRNNVILASAKHNLESMAFVGLTERQRMSQYVFEETFGVRFKSPFTQNEETYSKTTLDKSTPQELEEVRRVNSLDLELYAFAEQLLHARFQELKNLDSDFIEHYNYLGEEKGNHFSWDEIQKVYVGVDAVPRTSHDLIAPSFWIIFIMLPTNHLLGTYPYYLEPKKA